MAGWHARVHAAVHACSSTMLPRLAVVVDVPPEWNEVPNSWNATEDNTGIPTEDPAAPAADPAAASTPQQELPPLYEPTYGGSDDPKEGASSATSFLGENNTIITPISAGEALPFPGLVATLYKGSPHAWTCDASLPEAWSSPNCTLAAPDNATALMLPPCKCAACDHYVRRVHPCLLASAVGMRVLILFL